MTRVVFILLAGAVANLAAAQDAVLEGRVTAGNRPVAFANIGIVGATYGAAADADGVYRIEDIQPGTYTVAASAVGYRTAEAEVKLEAGETRTLNFELEETVIESEGVVVTGTLIETFVKDSPVKVDVVSARLLQKMPTSREPQL